MEFDNNDPKVQQVGLILGNMAEKIETYFKGDTKVTIIVRNPDIPGDTDMIVTNDKLKEAIGALERMIEKGKT